MNEETDNYIKALQGEINRRNDGDFGMDESMKAFNAALCKVQSLLEGAFKDKANLFFKSSYADLESVWGVARRHLADNGFSVTQTPDQEGTRLITTLLHSSGAWRRGSWLLNTVKKDPQGYMASVTYARRGGLAAMLGIHQTDDDGNEASGRNEKTATRTSSKPPVSMPKKKDIVKEAEEVFNGKEIPLIANGQAKDLQARLDKLTDSAKKEFKKEFKHNSIDRLEKKLFVRVTKFVSSLEKKAKAA
tara:strand:- start:456 stop:1196 length:741 start_codon:yes stop_codon:yes gene_type:complete